MNDQKPEKKNKLMTSTDLICPLYHERMPFFLSAAVFDKSELENNEYINKYLLNAKYRDFKFTDNQGFPAGFPIEDVTFDENGFTQQISIRAMHRIACSDLTKNQIHFMFDPYVKWILLDYDNHHGSLIKFMIHDKFVPIKYIAHIYLKGNPQPIEVKVLHIDDVWNLEKEPGFLIYYYEEETNEIKSVYLDKNIITGFQVILPG